MIIGISGKIGSGKDLIGEIIQYLQYNLDQGTNISFEEYEIDSLGYNNKWEIVKFADSLKDIVCILTGCTRKQLEDIDFKNSYLGDEWIKLLINKNCQTNSICKYSNNGLCPNPCTNKNSLQQLTYRQLLQYLGTDLLRNQLHENCWVNSLFSKYKANLIMKSTQFGVVHVQYPNWIITDIRFLNEVDAVKDRGGIIIRVNRFDDSDMQATHINQHPSETAIDNYSFDHTIDNNGSIEDLIKEVKSILIKEKIIC